MNRIMALDLGDRRIGIALSDLMKIIASGAETYVRPKNDIARDIEYIAAKIADNLVDEVVIGLPINMDGTHGERVAKSYEFGEMLLARTGVKVAYQDERLSTVAAEKMLIEAEMRRDKRKLVIDKVAATIILQNYMDRVR